MKHKRWSKRIVASRLPRDRLLAISFAGVFAVFAVLFIISIHASTPLASFQAEDGSLSGSASIVADSNASGGKAVQFNTGSTGGCVISTILVDSCHPWLGGRATDYYLGQSGSYCPTLKDDSVVNEQLCLEQREGRELDIFHSYDNPGTTLDSTDIALATMRPNSYLYLNWKPDAHWAAVAGQANGGTQAGDNEIKAQADAIKAKIGAKKMFITIWHEPQNDVSSDPNNPCGANFNYKGGEGTPTLYKEMWANVEKIFQQEGVTNVVWVFDSQGDPDLMCLTGDLYPGDDLVDWIMSNAYGGPGETLNPNTTHSTNNNFVDNVNTFYKYASGPNMNAPNTAHPNLDCTADPNLHPCALRKEWGIVEWNDRDSSDSQAISYYQQAKAALDACTFPRLQAYMIFDSINSGHDTRTGYDFNFGNPQKSQTRESAYSTFALDNNFTDSSTCP